MRYVALALMLTLAGTGAPYVTPWLVKVVATDAGTMRIYADPLGCSLVLGGITDRVDRRTCAS